MTSARLPLPTAPLAGYLESLAARLVAQAPTGITITDLEGSILYVNDAFSAVTGYPRDAVLGQNPRVLQSGRHPPAFYQAMWRAVLGRGRWQGEIWNRRRTGEVYPEWLSISALRDPAGVVRNYFAVFRDISEHKREEEALVHRALHDPLTDLPNRDLFLEQLDQAVRLHRRRRERLAVLFLDLDGFKEVNDRLGHRAGDDVLRKVAGRLRHVLRASDVVARLGGDEFTALLGGITAEREVARCAAKLQAVIAEPMPLARGTCRVRASVGVAIYPDHATRPEELLQVADARMYRAKRRGGIRPGDAGR